MKQLVTAKNMHFSLVCFVIIFSKVVADKCDNLEGIWYNQLGSEISLKHSNDGRLYGIYKTAVERKKGSAGNTHSIILGKSDIKRAYYKILYDHLKQHICGCIIGCLVNLLSWEY